MSCRNQLPDEIAEEYITVLFNLIDLCNYGDLRDEMLRNRLVVGYSRLARPITRSLISERVMGLATRG